MTLRLGSLFSGIGGLELGLERSGLCRTVWQVEASEFCRRVLAKRWPDVPRFDDVRTVGELPPADIICGGFPCQDLSSAGDRAGLSGKQSGLWYEYARIIGINRPAIVVVENVASGRKQWLPHVRHHLQLLGYRTRAVRIDARDIGAPHNRARIFVIGYAHTDSQSTSPVNAEVARVPPVTGMGWYWGESRPGALRMVNGVPGGLDRLRALGNAVVPQCAEVIGHLIRKDLGR